MKRVSICIPVFNMQRDIERAIRSALRQTEEDIEVIVADNQSNDRTYEIAMSIQDPRLRVVRNERNLGAYGNHNRCLEAARGTWVKFLHGDDELLENCIAKMTAAVDQAPEDAALIGCGAIRYGQDEREFERTFVPSKRIIMKPAPPPEFILEGNIFGTPTMTLLHRNRLLAVGGFDLGMEPFADGDCWIHLRSRYSSVYLPEHLVIIRDDPPERFGRRVAFTKRSCLHTFRQIEKWSRLYPEMGSDSSQETLYAEWVCRETFRFWDASFSSLLFGKMEMLNTLWSELGRHHARAQSLKYYLLRRFLGRTAGRFRSQPWPIALADLQISECL